MHLRQQLAERRRTERYVSAFRQRWPTSAEMAASTFCGVCLDWTRLVLPRAPEGWTKEAVARRGGGVVDGITHSFWRGPGVLIAEVYAPIRYGKRWLGVDVSVGQISPIGPRLLGRSPTSEELAVAQEAFFPGAADRPVLREDRVNLPVVGLGRPADTC